MGSVPCHDKKQLAIGLYAVSICQKQRYEQDSL